MSLVVSSGPEAKKVTVPTFEGQNIDSVREQLQALNLLESGSVNIDSEQPRAL